MGDPHTSSTLLTEGKEDEEEGAIARSAGASLAARPDDVALDVAAVGQVIGVLTTSLPAREPWNAGKVVASDRATVAVIQEWSAAGRTIDNLLDACSSLGSKARHPTGLLVAHIRTALTKPVPVMVSAAVPLGQDKKGVPATTASRVPQPPVVDRPLEFAKAAHIRHDLSLLMSVLSNLAEDLG